jgi:hypothetical protein
MGKQDFENKWWNKDAILPWRNLESQLMRESLSTDERDVLLDLLF